MPLFPTGRGQQGQGQGLGTLGGNPNTVSTEPLGIRTLAAYPLPGIEAMLDGERVTLIASCDWAGHSPAEKYVDSTGKINFEETEKFTVIDKQLLPISEQQMNEVRQNAYRVQR